MIQDKLNLKRAEHSPKVICSLGEKEDVRREEFKQIPSKARLGIVFAPSAISCRLALIDALSIFTDIPSSIDIIYIIGDAKMNGVNIVETLLAYNRGSIVLYDETKQYEGIIKPNEIFKTRRGTTIMVKREEPKNTIDEARYLAHIEYHMIALQANFLVRTAFGVNDNILLEDLFAPDMIAYARDCWRVLTDDKYKFPIPETNINKIYKKASEGVLKNTSYRCLTERQIKGERCWVLNDAVEKATNMINAYAVLKKDMCTIIDTVLDRANLPITFSPSKLNRNSNGSVRDTNGDVRTFDPQLVREFFNYFGIYDMLEAVRNGVPMEDIFL